MSKYHNILLAADLSQREDHPVVEKAFEMIQDTQAKLTVCHVLEYHDYPYGTPFVSPNFKDWEKELETLANEKLNKLCEKLGISKENQILEKGSAKEKLVEIADRIKADLIIIGNHTGRGSDFVTLGASADFVIRNAGRDVLSVHVTA